MAEWVGSRSKARKRALDVLFEADQRGVDAAAVLATHQSAAEGPLNPYVAELVSGVVAHQDRLDELLSTYAQGWTLGRMPAVDRAVLRLGLYEVLYADDVPDPVAVDEAITLVKSLSTDDSPTFVAGLLGRLVDLKPSLAL